MADLSTRTIHWSLIHGSFTRIVGGTPVIETILIQKIWKMDVLVGKVQVMISNFNLQIHSLLNTCMSVISMLGPCWYYKFERFWITEGLDHTSYMVFAQWTDFLTRIFKKWTLLFDLLYILIKTMKWPKSCVKIRPLYKHLVWSTIRFFYNLLLPMSLLLSGLPRLCSQQVLFESPLLYSLWMLSSVDLSIFKFLFLTCLHVWINNPYSGIVAIKISDEALAYYKIVVEWLKTS